MNLPKKLKWHHGLAFFVVINLLGFGWGIEVQNIYLGLDKPWFAPPTWAFSLVWTINVVLVITGNIWAYNFYQELKSRRGKVDVSLISRVQYNLEAFGVWQIVSWINYAIFQYVSFGTQIPAMFFWPTFSMWVITVVSMFYAGLVDTQRGWLELGDKTPRLKAFWHTVRKGRSLIFTFTTLIIWLSLASLLGFYIWLNN
jgi:tryptophan-rich sensory protein